MIMSEKNCDAKRTNFRGTYEIAIVELWKYTYAWPTRESFHYPDFKERLSEETIKYIRESNKRANL